MSGTFYVGDRVRLGAMRGGEVVLHEGKPRVRFHGAKTLLWLDHCVPDEGPDGPIFTNTWSECQGCGNPTAKYLFCSNCEARSLKDSAAFDRRERQRENERLAKRGLSSIGVHVAGPIEQNGRVVRQRCARCQAQLAGYLSSGGDRVPTPGVLGLFRAGEFVHANGQVVARLAPWQRPVLTCTPRPAPDFYRCELLSCFGHTKRGIVCVPDYLLERVETARFRAEGRVKAKAISLRVIGSAQKVQICTPVRETVNA